MIRLSVEKNHPNQLHNMGIAFSRHKSILYKQINFYYIFVFFHNFQR